MRLTNIPLDNLPASIHFQNSETKNVVNNPKNVVKRLDLKDHPSPYLTGILDDFLKDPHLAPVMDTNRGCPYDCTF